MDRPEYMHQYWQKNKGKTREQQREYHKSYWQRNKDRLSKERKAKYSYEENGSSNRGRWSHAEDKPMSREKMFEWCQYIDEKWGVSIDNNMGAKPKYK
ncbi:hypothetical protein [Metallibacterium sp.]